MKILYVEDNSLDAELLIKNLKRKAPEIEIDIAGSYSSAVKILSNCTPNIPVYDLIITDVKLPDKVGYSIIPQIESRGLKIPVIVLTGEGNEDIAVAALRAGAIDYVVKKNDYLHSMPDIIQNSIKRFASDLSKRTLPLHVLYAEHSDPDIDLTLRHFAKFYPHMVLNVVMNAEEVFEYIDDVVLGEGNKKIDLLLLDYRLPGLHGLDIIKEILEVKKFDIPIIIVTGQGEEEVAVQALKLGAMDYIVKTQGYLQQLVHRLENSYSKKQLLKEKEALQSSEEKLRTLYDSANVGICILNLDGSFLSVNPHMSNILGYSESELLRLRFNDVTYHEDKEIGASVFSKMLAGDFSSANFEKRYIHKSGIIIFAQLSTVIVRNAQNTPLHFITFVHDITERKKIEEELIKSKEEAEDANKLKSSLLANMSHEFRTPLNGILGFTEILREELAGSVLTEMADKIGKSGRRLLNTLNSILTVIELENNEYLLTKTYIDLRAFCESLRNNFKTDASEKNLGLRLELCDSDYLIDTDQNILSKIMSYLVDNAIKYTNAGEIVIRTVVSITEAGLKSVRIQVADTGIGIKKEDQKLIFKEFKQVSEGFSRNFEGSGLGLSLAQKMARLINAEILVESELEQGSVFSLILPAEESALSEVQDEKSEPAARVKAKTEIQNKFLEVLLVEDNSLNAEVVRRYLSGIGKVDIAKDGVNAVKIADAKLYDLLLIDINLGRSMDGTEVLSQIKKNEKYKNIPSIALTGYASSTSRRDFLEKGFTEYLAKPFEKKSLLTLINKLFSH